MVFVKFWDQFCLRQSHLCDNRAERGWRWWVRRRLGAQTGAWTPQSLLLLCPPQHRLPLLLLLLPFLPPGKDRIHAELQVGLVRGGGRGGEVPKNKVGFFFDKLIFKEKQKPWKGCRRRRRQIRPCLAKSFCSLLAPLGQLEGDL